MDAKFIFLQLYTYLLHAFNMCCLFNMLLQFIVKIITYNYERTCLIAFLIVAGNNLLSKPLPEYYSTYTGL